MIIIYGYVRSLKKFCGIPNGTAGSDADQRLPGPARQHNHPWPRTPVSKHLPQRLLLVGPEDGGRLQVDVDVGVEGVVPEETLT